MGDKVEPRREFTEKQALEARNLGVEGRANQLPRDRLPGVVGMAACAAKALL